MWAAEHIAVPTHYTTHYPRSADGRCRRFTRTWLILCRPHGSGATTKRFGWERRSVSFPSMMCSRLPRRRHLDKIFEWRLILVGAGWFAEEARLFGVKFDRRWAASRESVEALRELWSKEEVSYEGEFIKFPPLRIWSEACAETFSSDFTWGSTTLSTP